MFLRNIKKLKFGIVEPGLLSISSESKSGNMIYSRFLEKGLLSLRIRIVMIKLIYY
jgi:hypothetical protein